MFCSLARNVHWQEWLSRYAPDLHIDLLKTLEGSSCKANKNKMIGILVLIKQRGLSAEFEKLIVDKFPYIEDREATKQQAKSNMRSLAVTPPPSEDFNKHKVFDVYCPHILTYPGKLIILGKDKDDVRRRVYNFIRNKIGVDWLMIEDRVYIEYFFEQNRETIAKVKPEDREIARYRRKHNIPDGLNET